MIIIKRNGAEEIFHREKVATAIYKANNSVAEEERLTEEEIEQIAGRIEEQVGESIHVVGVEDVQNMIENELMSLHAFELARSFITYRYSRALARKANSTDDQILALLARNNEEVKTENSNKNPIVNSVQRDYMAGEVSKDLCERILVPADVWEAHRDGRIHFHDSDYFAQHMHNCCLVNLEDMLQNGTVISETLITKPNSFQTACNVATQAISQIASNQYGGQSISLAHLAPFVDVSRRKLQKSLREEFENAGISFTEQQLCEVAEERLDSEIAAGVQSIQYELITLMTTNGQAPFVTLFMYIDEVPEGQLRDDLVKLIREVLRQRIKGVQNEKGVYITPAFPKLIYVLEEDNIHEDSKYYELTRLAAQCTAKRMVPDYISEKVMREMKEGDVYPCMGCRSFLTPDRCEENVANATDWKKGHKYYGRFNQGVVTLNLVDVACSSGGDYEEFWRILEERLELCHKALRVRHERLLGTPSDVAPILWQHGALARLEKGEPIDKLLYGGYSTLSLGYAGLHECVYYMTGKSHTVEVDFAMKVMQALNDACGRWREAENIDYSVYGTPLESTTYKFAKCLQKRFGIIKGVTDKNYITNSYHVHVTEEISAFAKLSFEAPFQKLSPGGAISYIEVPNMQNNIEAILSIMQYMYDNIMYAEINTKSDYCQVCGYDGEIKIVEDEHDKLVWECPNCGNRDQQKMNVARRTCGYIGTQFWNQGRTQEIKERVLHI
jgi:ribonucleoside-triphosphate reductase